MNKRVLILGVASVQMDAIMELKKLGYETYACAMANDGPGAEAADHFAEINILDVESIIDYIKKNNISSVYSVGSDLAMPVACKISGQLKLPHFVSEETAKICNNKDMMRKTLGNDFNGNVKFQVINSLDEKVNLDYPFILKPTDSQGQRGVYLINSIDEYKKKFEEVIDYSRSGTVIVEQYISGPELSVNGYIVDGKIKYLIPSDRVTWPQFTGLIHKHVVPTTNLSDKATGELFNVMQAACQKLGINNGPVYAQIKLEEEQPYIIEITPRLDGCHMWKLLNYYSGVNILKLTFEHLLKNDTTELDNIKDEFDSGYVLEFICQEPNTRADYFRYSNELLYSIEGFRYYDQEDLVRSVNGKYEKIGYIINKI